MLRDLLVHVDGHDTGRSTVLFAVSLSHRVGARLSGVHITPPPEVAPFYRPGQVNEVARRLRAKLSVEASTAEAAFKAETVACADATWFAAQNDVVTGICQKAKFSDMVIVGREDRQGPPERHPFPVSHGVAVQCGRPVLIVPPHVKAASLTRVAVAWDGSRESTRATHDSIPLLRLAESVHIIAVSPRGRDQPNEFQYLQRHLLRHAIESVAHIEHSHITDEHDVLRRNIEAGRFDLVVMGAYSHAMWMEFIFGGASESILASSKAPILVSH